MQRIYNSNMILSDYAHAIFGNEVSCKLLLSIFWLSSNKATAAHYKECEGVDLGIYVASEMSCAKYIYCAGASSFEGECLTGHYYDVDLDRCMDQELVTRCGGKRQTTSMSPEKLKLKPAAIKRPPKKPLKPIAAKFPASFSKADQKSLSVTLHVLQNTSSCLTYMVCYEGAGIPKVCTPAKLTSCTQRQTLQPVVECREGVYDFVPHSQNCAYFYYCSNGIKKLHRCPLTYTWHYERRACVHRGKGKCFDESLKLNENKTLVKKFVFNLRS